MLKQIMTSGVGCLCVICMNKYAIANLSKKLEFFHSHFLQVLSLPVCGGVLITRTLHDADNESLLSTMACDC